MSRIIKISFQDHPIVAQNSEPRTDLVTLGLDFFLLNETVKEGAVLLNGTQNAINAISDDLPLIITGESTQFTHDTPEGTIQITTNFGGIIDLYNTYCIQVTLTDHLGWTSVEAIACPTNLILTKASQPILTENGQPLIFIKPQAA